MDHRGFKPGFLYPVAGARKPFPKWDALAHLVKDV